MYFAFVQNMPYLLTPWSRAPLEKLTGSAASQEIPRIFVNLIALLLPGFILIQFSTAHSPKVFRSFCKFSISFKFVIFLQIIQLSANSLLLESMFLQISFTYTRKCSGPKTLSCSTTEVILTSLESYLPTLTLCLRPERNSFAHTTTLETTP